MAERGSLEQLIHEAANRIRIQCPTISMLVHVFFQIHLTVFENEDELGFGMYDIVQPDNVDMLELLHERDFADSGRWCTLFGIEVDLLEGNYLVCCPRAALQRGSLRYPEGGARSGRTL